MHKDRSSGKGLGLCTGSFSCNSRNLEGSKKEQEDTNNENQLQYSNHANQWAGKINYDREREAFRYYFFHSSGEANNFFKIKQIIFCIRTI